jgi:hypothetical protein
MIDSIRNEMLSRVIELFGESWTSIAYEMRGRKDDSTVRNPTCVVKCPPGSRSPFHQIETQLRPILKSSAFPDITLHLEILRKIDQY